jgi:hypothetical protein
LPLLRKVGHKIGHERSRKSPRFGVGIIRKEWIDRRSRSRWCT